MRGRPEVAPGEYKQRGNRAGMTFFVRPDLVRGTLREGFSLLDTLPGGLPLAMPVLRPADAAARQRRLLRLEPATLVAAGLLPLLLWHDALQQIISVFRWEPGYLAGLAPGALMAFGLLCYLPVLAHRVRHVGAPLFHGQQPHAWEGWAVSLCLMGFLLATQVAQFAQGAA